MLLFLVFILLLPISLYANSKKNKFFHLKFILFRLIMFYFGMNILKLRKKKQQKNNNPIYKEFQSFIKNIIRKDNQIAVAVSGGPDSLALAYLAKFLSLKEKINVKFFIVDHGLRKESNEV